MRVSVRYIAEDGTEFTDEQQCRQHEEFVIGIPRWIVNDQGEFGVSVRGKNYFYYKDGPPVEDKTSRWRYVMKREFGEVIRSRECVEKVKDALTYADTDPTLVEIDTLKVWADQYEWFTPVAAYPDNVNKG